MKVLVCGGRDYDDIESVYSQLSALRAEHNDVFVIHGGCVTVDPRTGSKRGADYLAGAWAHCHSRPCAEVKADWDKFGCAAGPIRNKWMLLLEPDLVLAFPGGKGTAHMVSIARKAGIEVREVE